MNVNAASCRVCGSPLRVFVDFGRMPLGNGFLSQQEFEAEYFYPLQTAFCENCSMVQLISQPPASKMFHDEYPFLTGTSAWMKRHFHNFAASILSDGGLSSRSFVMELGSNDGTFLETFKNNGISCLGIEPAKLPAMIAAQKGIPTLQDFFDEIRARNILKKHGQADVVYAANVMCHVPDIHSVLKGIRLLLKPRGFFIFEDPYLPDILAKTSYDQIYDEHVFYFSLSSLSALFKAHDLEIIKIEKLETHGGSMRYWVGHASAHPVSDQAAAQILREKELGLSEFKTYERFEAAVNLSRRNLLEIIKQLKAEGKRVVGYGATSKSTTVTNYAGLTPELIDFISDTTPAKQGKFNPGTHIPVLPYEYFSKPYPDVALLFAWNHKNEILAKENQFLAAGGRWIVYVPRVGFLEPAAHV